MLRHSFLKLKSLNDIENGDFILDTARLSKRKVVSERLSHTQCYCGEIFICPFDCSTEKVRNSLGTVVLENCGNWNRDS